MSGKHDNIITQRKQLFPDSRHQQIMIASGEIPSPDPAIKKHISAHENTLIGKVKAQAPGAMSWDMKDFHPRSQEVLCALFDQISSFDRLYLQGKAPVAEEIAIRHHRSGQGMIGQRAAMTLHNRRRIRHVVEMPMRQQEKIDFMPRKGGISTLGRIKKDIPLWRGIEETVRIQGSPGKGFEPIFDFVVRHKTQRKLIQNTTMTILKFHPTRFLSMAFRLLLPMRRV